MRSVDTQLIDSYKEDYCIAGIFCRSSISFSFLVEQIFSKRKGHSFNATCTKWLLRTKLNRTKSVILARTNIFPDKINIPTIMVCSQKLTQFYILLTPCTIIKST